MEIKLTSVEFLKDQANTWAGVQTFSSAAVFSAGADFDGDITMATTKDFTIFNTADETTNYERLRFYWSSNVAYIATEESGSGSNRELHLLAAGGATLTFGSGILLNAAANQSMALRLGGILYIQDEDASDAVVAQIASATGYARFGDATAATVSLEAANGLDVVAGNLTMASGAQIQGDGTGANGIVLKNLKNAAASALSGTQLDVEIDIGGTPYHFTVYPTKA